ncbi:5264_t:CDS:2 [Ambispora leptoticha]|uniref:5264_t:CDS:1 n=1 Tax=Ambispora leptoticha TaxID=144679 RepID=A0A9N9A5Y0_9GLOM|nr:5264_t:CDS:2 [Ambispora leptoticha]
MEEASRARKERLAALKKRKLEASNIRADSNEGELNDEGGEKQEIKEHSKINIATSMDVDETVEKQVEKLTREVAAEEEAKRTEEVDLFNLAPRKPNWDLRRDVEKKLARLDKKTQVAIAQLIRMRLQGETDAKTDLADAVNSQDNQRQQQAGDDSEDDDDSG